MIKIAIADDHPLVINGIKDMLASAPDIVITAAYLNGETLLAGLKKDQPDVLLLDIQMPDTGGDEIAAYLKKEFPKVRILTLTNFDNTLYVNSMINNGVLGYLLKNTNQETLIFAIKQVAKGKTFIDEKMREKVLEFRKQIQRKSSSKYALTPREKDILKLVAKGASNSDIAEKLFLSIRTIENYRLNLCLKLEVKNTAGLIRKAIDLGYYD